MRLHRPATALLGVSMLALATPALAQEQAAVAEAPSLEEAETIIVTGSRLARDPNAVAPVPISTLSAADFRAAGNVDTTATLRQLPALLASGTVADSIERGAGGVGQAVLDLRQLGANRTLVLVDGRRHVSGVGGSTAVDVSTIPAALIERVEVLTGGASAVYGADAVTGVVNYILKQDFEGLQIDAQTGISSRGDGTAMTISGAWGKNFAEGRGNITLSAGYTNEAEILLSDRSFTANNARANNSTTYGNPDRRFQRGDINPATMPNFGNYFRVGGPGPRTTRIPVGNSIPTASEFATLFPGVSPSAAEQALIDRAANSPLRIIARNPRFGISATDGLIFRADFRRFPLTDLNSNGVNDCNESYVGWTGFGGGGCYVSNPDGSVRIFNDGLVTTTIRHIGGDGAEERTNETSLTPGSERYFSTLTGNYEISPAVELFWDAKFARTRVTSRNSYNTFMDTAYIAPDNPFIPTQLAAEAVDGGGLLISRDNTDFGPGISTATRNTYRFVGGLRGELSPSVRYDFAVNYGRTDITERFSNSVLADRFLAATDAVRAPDGRIVCRSDLDSTATPPQPALPDVVPGFFTFRPGDGQCRPVNLFRGKQSASPQAVAFFTRPTEDSQRLEQLVATLAFSGDSGQFLNLPGGAIQYAVGVEYREEKSRNTFSDEDRGILEDGSFIGDRPDAQGFAILTGDPITNVNLLFTDQVRQVNTGGRFDSKEVFGEVRLPILKDRPFFHELSVEAAARYADYSTVGGAFTWNVAGTWAPVRDIRFRGSYSQAIRAPDIFELFSPAQPAFFTVSDPCEIADLNVLIADGVPNAQTRKTNCAAALTALGVDPNTFVDPLTARFAGTSGGNPDLQEETAKTWTFGALIQPRFIPGLTLSADYYSINIEDAIAAVDEQDIVNNCYDLTTFPNQFCSLFTRRRPDGGFSSLQQTQINFGRIETAGVDMTAAYGFDIGAHAFNMRVTANWIEKLNRFFNPADSSQVNPGLREQSVPEWSGVGSINWQSPGGFGLTWRTQYIGNQAIAGIIQIESIDSEFGPAGFAGETWVHDLSASFTWNEGFEIYGGINNLTDTAPFIASRAYPVSGIGRFYFLGMRAKF